MKVMLLNSLYYPNIIGGAEKSVQLLAEGLNENGHQVVVVSLGEYQQISYVNKIKVYYLHHNNIFWGGMPSREKRFRKMWWHVRDIFNPGVYKALTQIVREEQPDVIHTNILTGFSSAPLILAHKFGIPVVHTLREYSLMCEKGTMFRNNGNCHSQCMVCWLFTLFKRWLSNHGYISHVVGLSAFIINRHKRAGYFSQVNHSRVFNGIRTIDSATQPPTTLPLKILYLGRIEKGKGVMPILDAAMQMDTVELYLGGVVLDKEIQACIDRGMYPETIKFLGFIDPEQIFDQVDVVIVPSLWHEPFGRVVIEAYQHGKPVIASNRGGLPEIVMDGKTGFLYDPDQTQALVDILQRLMNDPGLLDHMRENIKTYAQEFRNQHIARQYEMIYQTVCKGQPYRSGESR